MSENPKKQQNFLQGAALLALSTAVVKVIGAFYKLPLKMAIGDQGYAYFITAYDIYSVLLMISTAGLPVAMSRMVSQAASLGQYRQVRRVYKTARTIYLGLGFVSSLLMMVFCHQLAEFQKQPDAWAAILCLGPSAFLVCCMAAYRGFFQGQGNMLPTSVSQVIEAVVKLVVGLVVAFAVIYYTSSVSLAAGGAILGVTVSCLAGAVYLAVCFHKDYRTLPDSGEDPDSFGVTAKRLLTIAIPITIGSAGLQILTVLETNLFMGQLLTANGLSQDMAEHMKGVYNMCQTVFNMPCAFIIPITVSILPAITANLTLCRDQDVKATEESAARITGLISLPCAVGLMVLARPVMALLGGYSGWKLDLAARIMQYLGISVLLYSGVQLTNTLLQAHGHAQLPVINMLSSGVVKLVVVYVLVGNPVIGILGAPMGVALCNFAISALNLFGMRRVIPQKPAILKNLLRPLIPALVMGGAAYGTWWGLTRVLGEDGSRLILCALPVLAGVVVYALMVVLCRSITREDCMLLPKGDKIAKLLHL